MKHEGWRMEVGFVRQLSSIRLIELAEKPGVLI